MCKYQYFRGSGCPIRSDASADLNEQEEIGYECSQYIHLSHLLQRFGSSEQEFSFLSTYLVQVLSFLFTLLASKTKREKKKNLTAKINDLYFFRGWQNGFLTDVAEFAQMHCFFCLGLW